MLNAWRKILGQKDREKTTIRVADEVISKYEVSSLPLKMPFFHGLEGNVCVCMFMCVHVLIPSSVLMCLCVIYNYKNSYLTETNSPSFNSLLANNI